MKTITHLDMSAFLADYTAKVVAEEKRRQAVREAVANGTYVAPAPATEGWYVSDRH